MKQETLGKMVSLIYKADDEEMRTLYSAMKIRSQVLRSQKAANALRQFKVGDRVVFTNIKPKYMMGVQGVITGRRQTKFNVLIDDDYDTGRFGREVVVPANCISAA